MFRKRPRAAAVSGSTFGYEVTSPLFRVAPLGDREQKEGFTRKVFRETADYGLAVTGPSAGAGGACFRRTSIRRSGWSVKIAATPFLIVFRICLFLLTV